MEIETKDEVEPALIPSELQPSPPSKAASVISGEPDNEKKYETIQTIKMTDSQNDRSPKTLSKSMEKTASVMASSLNLLPTVEARNEPIIIKGLSVNTKLGIIQLILSLLLSAFGGLLIARSSSLAWLCSGVWAGILAGITGSLGLMNIKQLINGFLACSLICVASSTLALTFTCIGLLRDFNMMNSTSHQNQEFEAAVFAACGLTFLLVLHLLTSMFSVYYSAMELCSKDVSAENLNYEKFQNISLYLKSLQNAGVTNCYDLNGYQNYINNAKLHRQRSSDYQQSMAHHSHHSYPIQPIYAPISHVSSNYMPNHQMYTLPHSYQSNFYQEFCYNERRPPSKSLREHKHKKPALLDDSSKINMHYMGEDRDIAESYLKSMEVKEAK